MLRESGLCDIPSPAATEAATESARGRPEMADSKCTSDNTSASKTVGKSLACNSAVLTQLAAKAAAACLPELRKPIPPVPVERWAHVQLLEAGASCENATRESLTSVSKAESSPKMYCGAVRQLCTDFARLAQERNIIKAGCICPSCPSLLRMLFALMCLFFTKALLHVLRGIPNPALKSQRIS